MKINHAGSLSKDYFHSYFKLILASRTSDIENAKKIIFERLFNNKQEQLGKETYHTFLAAYHELMDTNQKKWLYNK